MSRRKTETGKRAIRFFHLYLAVEGVRLATLRPSLSNAAGGAVAKRQASPVAKRQS